MGIYRGNGNRTTCFVDKGLSQFMTLSLKYKNSSIVYYPMTTQWITGFDPRYQCVNAADLQATFKIYFKDNASLYYAFKNTWSNKDKSLTFNDSDYSVIFVL